MRVANSNPCFFQALKVTEAASSQVQKYTWRQTIDRLGFDYLREEIENVIIAGQLETLAAYLAAPRSGRKLPLNRGQRESVWRIYETLTRLLSQQGKETWHQMHARAERFVEQNSQLARYDAVIIDEAQDLAPSVLRLLVKLSSVPNHLFIAADADQSIYGSHFNWSAIHTDLQFQGRTAVLEANYRSTQEIGEAAHAYLALGGLENEPAKRLYTYNGPLPVLRTASNNQDEAQLLASFLTAAARECKLGLSSCAILCPTEKAGRELATALSRYQIEATFMAGHYLSLIQSGIKILTLNSAKGLEFPIVALAGFSKSQKYLQKPAYASREEQEERLALERRLLFVGMTRAMRALLVAIPARTTSPLLAIGFDQRYWNMKY